MNIKINGESKVVKDSITVTELLDIINASTVGIAVEVNLEIVPRSAHSSTELKEGDLVEIVKMVGGG